MDKQDILKQAKEINKQKSEQKKKLIQERKQKIEQTLKASIAGNEPIIVKQDAISFLNSFNDNSIDLLITDPPYSTDVKDIHSFAQEWLTVALKKVKDTGRVYVCIGAYPVEQKAYFDVFLNQEKFVLDNPLIWTYKNTLGITPKLKYNLNYQVILHGYSKQNKPLNTEITNEMFSVMEINAPDGRLGVRYHTWQKPLELGERLIRHANLEKNALVVDCFACTGTFLIAAAKHGYQAKGCDINVDNIAIAVQRGVVHG